MATVYMLTTADETVDQYSTRDYQRLSAAARADRFKQHWLVDSPDLADIILFVGSTYIDHRDIRLHPFLRHYVAKCFLFHSGHHVIPFVPGVYVNITKRWHSPNRTASGSYLQIIDWDYIPYLPSLATCRYLFSFVGSTRSHPVREKLLYLRHPRAYLADTSASASREQKRRSFFMVDYQEDAQTDYGEILSQSKFVLCPRGYGCSSWRLFETMKAGRVPVIISDQWVTPAGPDWQSFSIRIKQKDVARIPALLERHEAEAETMGRLAREAWEAWFSNETFFHRIVEWCLQLKRQSRIPASAYLQYLRPFFMRHVVVPEIKTGLLALLPSID